VYLGVAGTVAGLLAVTVPPALANPGPTPIFDPTVAESQVVYNKTRTGFGPEYARWRDQGYYPYDLEIANLGDDVVYSAVFHKVPRGLQWKASWEITPSQFTSKHAEFEAQGLRIADCHRSRRIDDCPR
jgi:hypothetical protein